MRNATDNPIRFPVHSTRNPVTGTGMKQAHYVDSGITIQNLPAADGFIAFTNKKTFAH
ncbi:hypothetical protein QF039_001311 [Pseudomonas sp. W2I6]|nr:hypothetical protein [Pseudomonas sp. W2I6]